LEGEEIAVNGGTFFGFALRNVVTTLRRRIVNKRIDTNSVNAEV